MNEHLTEENATESCYSKTVMKEIAERTLEYIQSAKDEPGTSPETCSFPKPVYDFICMVYDSGIWDSNFLDKRKSLEKADLSRISLEDVYSYFTAIVAIERCFSGFVEQKICDGTLEQLLIRYLNLIGEETK